MRDALKTRTRIRDLAAEVRADKHPDNRAPKLVELQRLSGEALRDTIDECLEEGFSWRQIGAAAGVPFQTLQRQYVKGGPIVLMPGKAATR